MVDLRNPIPCDEAIGLLTSRYRDNRDPIADVIPVACELIAGPYADVLYQEGDGEGEHGTEPSRSSFLRDRLNTACILAESLNAEAELVVASLIGPGLKAKLLYRNTLEPQIGSTAYNRVSAVLKTVAGSFSDVVSAAGCVDERLWDRALDQRYQELLRKIRRKKTPRNYFIRQAFAQARAGQKERFRPTGEPCLAHPLAVAHILADRGAESELIAAALLQDEGEGTAEAPGAFPEGLEQVSPQITRYVEDLRAIERACRSCMEIRRAQGESFRPMDWEDPLPAAVNRLLNASKEGKSMIHAVYIKAAERFHELLTIDGLPEDEILNLLEETETFYLPIFRAFGINEFVPTLEDQLWREKNPGLYQRVLASCRMLLRANAQNLRETQEMLNALVETQLERKCEDLNVPAFFVETKKEELLPYRVYQRVKNEDPDDICDAINKYSLPLLELSFVESNRSGRSDLKLFASVFIKTLTDNTESLKYVISSIRVEPVSERKAGHVRIVIELENDMTSRIVLRLYDREDYYLYKNGSSEGVVLPERTEDPDAQISTIRVRRSDNTEIYLPNGSTALDVAFSIHGDVGLYARRASINGSVYSERLLFCPLRDGDKVVIDKSPDKAKGEDEARVRPKVRIEWLNHVKTSTARKRITRWLQERYEKGSGKSGGRE